MNSAPRLESGTWLRLSIMMFLQYAIWGAWLPLLWPFLAGHRGFDGNKIGTMFAVGAVGAIVAPFIAGQIADRYFSTERFLAISHILGAITIWQLAKIETYAGFLVFSLVYSIIYSPTLSLTNSLAFHHLPDRDRDFGRVRVWGTVGWIIVGISIGQWLLYRHTIDDGEATRRLVAERLFDSQARRELVEHYQLQVGDEIHFGKVVSRDAGGVELELVGENQDDLLRVEAGSYQSLRPMYEVLAAPGRAQTIKEAIDVLDMDDREEVREDVQSALVAAAAFNDDALAEPIHSGQQAGMADAFRLSAVLGVLMGIFCFFLPHTPPSRGEEQYATFEALREVRRNPLLVLFILAVPISCIHQFYFVHTAEFLGKRQVGAGEAINRLFGVGGGGLMTIGQMTEIAVLALIPLVAKKVSRKSLLTVGIVAYTLRMALFAYVDSLPTPQILTLVLGVALHGLCFGCFIFVAFMIVDEETTSDVRASAQSLFNLVIVGIGIIVGSKIAGWVALWATATDETGKEALDYSKLFSVPMWASLACLVVLLLFYPGGRRTAAGVT